MGAAHLRCVATQFLTHVSDKFIEKSKIAKNNGKPQKNAF
jgi:hypothetical protein